MRLPSSDHLRPPIALTAVGALLALLGLAPGVAAASTVELLCAPDIPTAKLSVQLDWSGGDCLPGGPGQPANLVGFAFPFVNSQAPGDITRIRMFFNEPTVGSLNVYLWRDNNGTPDDTCGNERLKLLHAPIMGDSIFSDYRVDPPLSLGLGETVWLGAIYESSSIPPTWYLGRIPGPSQPGRGLANLTGDHADWFDLDDFGYGQCYGVRLELEVNSPPVAVAGGPYCGRNGTGIGFDGRGSSDPDGDALTYHWDFGDGATATGAAPVHSYATGGTYSVVLTVSDPGNTDADTTMALVDIPATVRVPEDMTLPAALALAARCTVDSILVAAGSYEGPFTLAGTDAVLLAVDGPGTTELGQAESNAPVLRVTSGRPRIEGFTLSGAGAGLRLESAAEVIGCRILNCGGTGIEIDARDGVHISRCVVVDNGITATGGGIETAGTHQVTHTTVHGNVGFGIRSRPRSGEPSDTVIDRCLITATRVGPATECQAEARLTVSCTDLWANAGGDDICGRNAGDNLSVDPLYCDPALGDLSLRADSPCLALATCGAIGALGPGCTLHESRISGRVASLDDGPLAGLGVAAVDAATGAMAATAITGNDGSYALTALGSGTYVVEVLPTGTLYIGLYFPDLPSYVPENLGLALPITLNGADQVSDIDFSLALGGGMRGRVVDESNGAPLAGVPVHPFPLGGGELWRPTMTNENGVFETVPLPTGQYGALTPGIEGFFGEVYLERMNPAAADPIYVFAGQRVININFTLLPGSASVEDGPAPPRTALALDPPIPNPFNPSTRIRFRIPAAGRVRLDVFDIQGRHVRSLLDGTRLPGEHESRWDGRDDAGRHMPSGIYLLRLEAQGRGLTREAVLLR